MNDRDVTTSFGRTLVDEWARSGVRRAVVSPGSRNAPLLLALERDGRIAVDVVVDERSAGFLALGIGRAGGFPAVVCCTSGSAAANLHPAVVEAHHGRVPLLVVTADRPPELRDCGAGQTIDQARLFGAAVRWFHDPGPPDAAGAGSWRALACRAVASALGPPAGPVHLNVPLREPLVPTGAPLLEVPARADGEPWVRVAPARRSIDAAEIARLAELVRAHGRGVVVAGWGARVAPATATRFATAAGWPVLADPLSGLRAGPHAVSTYDALLRDEDFAGAHRPDAVLRLGAPLTSKVAGAWIETAGVSVLVDPDRARLDPAHAAGVHVAADADALLGALADALGAGAAPSRWLTGWHEAERRARRAIDHELDVCELPVEGRIARDLAAAVPDGVPLVVGSSLPVRALEWCMAPREGLRVLANRGANGIDGFVSTVLGIARVCGPTVALCGDLCFLHDVNGLSAAGRTTPATFVVVDNGGGGIFAHLPPRELPEFERLFVTAHGLDVVAVASAHGAAARRVEGAPDPAELATPGDGVRVEVVPVDPDESVRRHRRCWEAAASAVHCRAP